MKYFNQISSLSELKDQYRKLAIANHPDKGGDTVVMQEINGEFDVLYAVWKNVPEENVHPDKTEESARDFRRTFYTQNRWEGSRYESRLTTKEIAARIRTYAKERWPQYTFSIRIESGSMCSSIYVILMAGPEPAFISVSKSEERKYYSTIASCIDRAESELTANVFTALKDVTEYMNSYRYDDSDGMFDYFDTNFYTHVGVGKWDKPYQVKPGKQPRNSTKTKSPVGSIEGIEMVDYSEKAIAIFGNTKSIKEKLSEIGGRFNGHLTYGDGKRPGWIFSKTKLEELKSFLSM